MKIKDGLILGMITGVIANLGKGMLMGTLKKRGYAGRSFTDTAAAFFLHGRDIKTPLGQLVGTIADYSIALLLGISHTCFLRRTGKKNWLPKGVASGSITWVVLYGFLGTLGKSNLVYPTTARTAFSSYLGHTLFGILNNFTAIKFGHDDLFIETQKTENRIKRTRPPRRTKISRIPTG
ncbi:MAG: hypothetical protein GX318_02305 [Clostridia bacterium]|nr:hypothetical protein [Clostridia bacterium]